MNLRSLGKKSQEEIVGFVLIVVIVAVIVLIIFAVSLRKSLGSERESVEVYYFLESIMHYTTECSLGYETDYISVNRLLVACFENKICFSGINSCSVLNTTLNELFSNSWNIGSESSIKGYIFSANYSSGRDKNKIIELRKGNCTGSFVGSEYISYPVESVLKLC